VSFAWLAAVFAVAALSLSASRVLLAIT